nr:DUF3311 domain-containing protein [Streptomyces sp. SID3343]
MPPTKRHPRGRRVVAGVLLVVPIVVTLAVPLYGRASGALFGLPFFYWYQPAWVLLAGACTTIALRLLRPRVRALPRAARRAPRHDGPPRG